MAIMKTGDALVQLCGGPRDGDEFFVDFRISLIKFPKRCGGFVKYERRDSCRERFDYVVPIGEKEVAVDQDEPKQ